MAGGDDAHSEQTGTDSATAPATQNVAANLAQAFQDLARGEQTATAMESKLSSLEERIDSLLEYFEGENPAQNNHPKDGALNGGRSGET